MFENFFGKRTEDKEKEEPAHLASWKTNTLEEIVREHPDLKGMDYESAWNESRRRNLVKEYNLPDETTLDEAEKKVTRNEGLKKLLILANKPLKEEPETQIEDIRAILLDEIEKEILKVEEILKPLEEEKRATEKNNTSLGETSKILYEIYLAYKKIIDQAWKKAAGTASLKEIAEIIIELENKRPHDYYRRHDPSDLMRKFYSVAMSI